MVGLNGSMTLLDGAYLCNSSAHLTNLLTMAVGDDTVVNETTMHSKARPGVTHGCALGICCTHTTTEDFLILTPLQACSCSDCTVAVAVYDTRSITIPRAQYACFPRYFLNFYNTTCLDCHLAGRLYAFTYLYRTFSRQVCHCKSKRHRRRCTILVQYLPTLLRYATSQISSALSTHKPLVPTTFTPGQGSARGSASTFSARESAISRMTDKSLQSKGPSPMARVRTDRAKTRSHSNIASPPGSSEQSTLNPLPPTRKQNFRPISKQAQQTASARPTSLDTSQRQRCRGSRRVRMRVLRERWLLWRLTGFPMLWLLPWLVFWNATRKD